VILKYDDMKQLIITSSDYIDQTLVDIQIFLDSFLFDINGIKLSIEDVNEISCK